MSELLAYMCFGERLPPDVLDEIDKLERHALRTATSFPVFAIFPSVTKRLFRKRWAAHVAVRRRQEEVYAPLIHATSAIAVANDNQPPCYARSLLALRVPDDRNRPLTDAEMVSLCSEFLNAGTDTTVTLLEWIMAELVNHPDVQAKVYEEVTRPEPSASSTTPSTSRRSHTLKPSFSRACACTRQATTSSRMPCGATRRSVAIRCPKEQR